jgi:hypothetical protein
MYADDMARPSTVPGMRDQPDDQLPQLFTGPEARALGWSRDQVEWAGRSGRWRRLRRGIYTVDAHYQALDAIGRHLLECRAALRVHDHRHVLSHLSAALTYGLPSPIDGPGRPTLTIGEPRASTDRQDDLVVQVASLREHEAVTWREGRRTTPSRTVADCLRHLPAPDAVAIADAAVRRGLTDLARIEEVLRWQDGWPYLAHGRAAYQLIDWRRENWLESFSFVTLHHFRIPLAIPQVKVYNAKGHFLGRVDGYWPDCATVGEADGREKYVAARSPGGDEPADSHADLGELARRAVIQEKEREDRLRDAGLELARWSTPEILHRPQVVAERIRAARRRGDPARFTGYVRIVDQTRPLAVESGFEDLPDAS